MIYISKLFRNTFALSSQIDMEMKYVDAELHVLQFGLYLGFINSNENEKISRALSSKLYVVCS